MSRIVREAPLVCIEVLSPEDTWQRVPERLNDYLAMGVDHVWCFNPECREARRYTADGFDLVREAELMVAGTKIRVNVAEVFSVLDIYFLIILIVDLTKQRTCGVMTDWLIPLGRGRCVACWVFWGGVLSSGWTCAGTMCRAFSPLSSVAYPT